MQTRYLLSITLLMGMVGVRVKAQTVTETTALELYKTAKALEGKKDYRNAVELLKKAYKIAPNEYIRFHLAMDYFRLDDCSKAQDEIAGIDENRFEQEERARVHAALTDVLISCNLRVGVEQKGMDAPASWMVAFKTAETDEQRAKVVKGIKAHLAWKGFTRWLQKQFLHGKAKELAGFWSLVETMLGPEQAEVIRAKAILGVVHGLLVKGRVNLALKALQRVENALSKTEEARRHQGGHGLSCDTPDKAAACALFGFAKRDYLGGRCDLADREFGLITRLYKADILRFYFALSLLCNGKKQAAIKVLWAIKGFIAPALPHDISAAVMHFKQKKADDVMKLGAVLYTCEARGPKACEKGLQRMVKAGRITACQVTSFFTRSPELGTYFNVDCMAEKAVSGKKGPLVRVSKGVAKGRAGRSLRPYAWTAAAVAGVSLVTSAILLGVAQSQLKDLNDNWGEKFQSDAKAQQDAAYKKRRWGWAMLGVGLGTGAAAVVLFILEPKHLKVAPAVTSGRASVNFRVEF